MAVRFGFRLCENACAVLRSALLRKICWCVSRPEFTSERDSHSDSDRQTCSKTFSPSLGRFQLGVTGRSRPNAEV